MHVSAAWRTVLGILLLVGVWATDRAASQTRLDSSDLAGVQFSTASWDWSGDPENTKSEAINTAAAVVDRSCGRTEFHAWQVADQPASDAIRQTIGADFERSGWQIEPAAFDEGGQAVHLARSGGRELVLEWLFLPDQDALALFLCEAGPAEAAPAAQAAHPANPQADTAEPAEDGIGILIGVAVAFGAVGFGFVWNTLRHRRHANAAATWPTVGATVLSSEMVIDTHTDADNDTTTHYVPTLRYGYTVSGQTYEGSRISFGDARFSSREGAQAVLDRYPARSAVEIRYNPADPSQAVIETEKPGVWKIVVGAVLVVFALVVVAVTLLM